MNKISFQHFDLLHIGIFIIDEDYTVVFWNKTISNWTNISKELIERKHIKDFFPNLIQKKYTRRLGWLLRGGPPIIFSPQLHPHLLKCPLPNNKNRIVKTTVSNIQLYEDKKKLLIFTIEDMTIPMDQIMKISQLRQSALNEVAERKRIESELLKSRKLESIWTLSQGIAHDFNNILAIIAGNISILSMKHNYNDKSKKIMTKIEDSVFKASNLAKKLISFSSSDADLIDKEPINFLTLIINLDLTEKDKDINFDINIQDDLYLINGSETQILEMLNNIISNAIESIDETGDIDISAENIQFAEKNDLNIPSGKYIKISIRDTGHGISEENIDNVFDPYFTTKTEVTKKGLGFGLSIAHSIVKKHNGHISITSKEKKGTTVTILLQPYLNSLNFSSKS